MLRNSILVKIRYVFALSTAYEYFLIITHNSQGLRLGSLLVPLVVTDTKLSKSKDAAPNNQHVPFEKR